MAWTMHALIGLSFGIGCVLTATACDDSSGDDSAAATSTTTTGATATGTTGGTPAGTPIPFMGGWVPIADNSVGIQGAFYTFGDSTDGGGSMIAPVGGATDFSAFGAEVCAEGTAGQVMDGADGMPAYSMYWGAAIGLNLSQDVGGGDPLPYDAATNKVIGFSFVVGGTNPIPTGGELRFNINVAGEPNTNYCDTIPAAGAHTFMLADLHQSCWDATSATLPTPDPSKLQALHWQYVTNVIASYEFNLCVSDLSVITSG